MNIIKKTKILKDKARCIFKKTICFIEVKDINAFIKSKEESLGEMNIDFVKHEIYDNFSHILTIHQADIDPAGDAERTIIYEWDD